MTRACRVNPALLATIVLVVCSRGVAETMRLGGKTRGENNRRKLQLFIAGNSGNPPPEMLPLKKCWGDCDTDADCAEGLICFQRDANEEVPGCDGGRSDTSMTDYCIIGPDGTDEPSDSPTQQPSEKPIEQPTTKQPTNRPTKQPTNRPTNRPTDGPTSPPTEPPTKKPTEQPSEQPTKLPSAAPSQRPTVAPTEVPSQSPTYGSFGRIEYVGNEGTFYSPYPMPVCKGDCDTDDDCAQGLYCHQRNSFGPVPYCDGGETESSTADFCAWTGNGEPPEIPGPPPDGYFRLKLYWQQGYKWQNETFEREWCMMYDYEGYPGTGLCWYGDKDQRCDHKRIYVAKCVDDPRMWFTFVNVTNPYSSQPVDEFLIMTADGARCFERESREVFLAECDASNSLQRWIAMNGDFFGDKFEISQLGYTHQCVTNDHHPKSGEVIETHDCEDSRAEDSQTSFWERF